MPTYRKRGNAWRVEVCINGQCDSATLDTKAEAKIWAASREVELRKQSVTGVSQTMTLGDVFERYAKDISTTKRGMRWEQIRLAKLGRHPFSETRLADINESHIAGWRDDRLREASPASVQRELTLVKHALEIARREWRLITKNPCADVRNPKSSQPRDRLISTDEIDRICLACGWHDGIEPVSTTQRVAVAFLFAIETGMRAGEVCGLTCATVDLEKKTAYLPITKNGRGRSVPLSSRAVQLIQCLPCGNDASPLFGMSSATQNAGIEYLAFQTRATKQ